MVTVLPSLLQRQNESGLTPPSVRALCNSTMLTAIAVRRDVVDPDLFHCDPLGLLVQDSPDESDLVFCFADPCAVLPVLHRSRIVLSRWGCRRTESRVLPCTGWTTTRSAAAVRYWRSVGGVAVLVPAYLGFEGGTWVRLHWPVRAVLAHDERGQPHAFIACEACDAKCDDTRRSRICYARQSEFACTTLC
jgi:hypothetical protein